MEIVLITETYLSSVPFSGEVIKNQQWQSQQWRKQTRSKKVEPSPESSMRAELGMATGNRVSLKSACVDQQLTCFVLPLIETCTTPF